MPSNARNQLLDSSARNLLINMVVAASLRGLRLIECVSAAETIDHQRAKRDPNGGGQRVGEVRRNPWEPAWARGNRRKKPTGDPVGFHIWWSWGDLNPRPQAFFGQIYMFSGLI